MFSHSFGRDKMTSRKVSSREMKIGARLILERIETNRVKRETDRW